MVKKPRAPRSVRLADHFFARLQAYASSHAITTSAALRIAAQRGLAEMEREASKKDPPQQQLPLEQPAAAAPARRRVLSPGIG